MDRWLKERIIKLHENDVDFSAILELTGKDRKEVEGVLGEHYAKEFNQKQKEVGLVS